MRSRRLALAALLPGGFLVLAGVILMFFARAWLLYQATGTVRSELRRFRFLVAWAVFSTFPLEPLERQRTIARLVLAIIWQESRGNPELYVHDLGAAGGPGVGPMAVNRTTAKDLGLWQPPIPGLTPEQERSAFLTLAQDEAWGVRAGVAVLAAKLKAAGGDLADAIRRYNGSATYDGPDADTTPEAIEYRDAVLASAREWFGPGVLS